MRKKILLDTGPLVAFINNRENSPDWAVNEWKKIEPPFFTCEAVITETCFILRDFYGGEGAVMSLLDTGIIQISFRISGEIGTVRELMKRYQNVPMSLADVCFIRMSELILGTCLLTLDSDFWVYWKNKNEMMNLIIADGI
ncbi:MAG: PIN domain-containing protein [Nostoc sp.]|uniref:type II toxin-antitoxin system VapC family toxin n=1 Tax=Nostoc sp. TaxID=1180 RepID=UPI002FF61C8C